MARENEVFEDIFPFFFLVMTCSLSNLSALSRTLRPQRLICGDPHCAKVVAALPFYHRSQSYEAMFQHFVPQRKQLHLEELPELITLLPFFQEVYPSDFFGWWLRLMVEYEEEISITELPTIDGLVGVFFFSDKTCNIYIYLYGT